MATVTTEQQPVRSLRQRVTAPHAPTVLMSLGNRIALLFSAITLLAIGVLYMYVAPGLQTRLLDGKLASLAVIAQRYSHPIAETVGTTASPGEIEYRVDEASLQSNSRVTLLGVQGSDSSDPIRQARLVTLADSSGQSPTTPIGVTATWQAVRSGRLTTAVESTGSGIVAEAALPVRFFGRVAAVIVYSAPTSDMVRSVATVRHEILVAGAIALAFALIGGYLTARWLQQRVRRLEQGAARVAAGDFSHPIPVDARDELGQLAIAFNDMQRQLAQLDIARKRFIATASHELRTPLFSLGGFVELLEDEELDAPTRRRFLEQISEQVERLRKLSVDLLDLSKLESGSLELRTEPVDLGELARAVAGEFEPSLGQHDSTLEVHLTPGLYAVCDPVRVAQIIRILIDNARVHTGEGTDIVVSANRRNGCARISVSDNGPGIDPEALPRIFEPFYTADGSTGSGLGLAVASELADRMDGQLTAFSIAGRTEFTLELPV
jgi:signal transduction histidine kinase